MNKKAISIVAIIIVISIIGFAISELQTGEKKISEQSVNEENNFQLSVNEENNFQLSMNEENNFQLSMNEEIQAKYDKIEQDRKNNLALDQPFIPAKRDWPTSGPFKIDRSQYLLGEKIFVNIDTLAVQDEGTMIFLRPLNDTHYKKYYSMPFDGSKDRNNFYFTPDLNKLKGICDKSELVGTWKIVFEGTNYPNLEFKVIDKILHGKYDSRYDNVC